MLLLLRLGKIALLERGDGLLQSFGLVGLRFVAGRFFRSRFLGSSFGSLLEVLLLLRECGVAFGSGRLLLAERIGEFFLLRSELAGFLGEFTELFELITTRGGEEFGATF